MPLAADATRLLRRMIGHNTVNPPGNERVLQEELAAELIAAGFEVQLLGRTYQRPNLIARLPGHMPGPTLALLSHVDTVLAEPDDWSRDPWSGEIVDGMIWGRGAQDMKSQTAAEVAAALDFARAGRRPTHGDLLVLCVVDEEVGGTDGAIWLCENHPDLVRCDYLINEGAGALIPYRDQRLFGLCIAEKGVQRFSLTVRGRPGHGSMPTLADNPLPRLARLIDALGTTKPEHDVTEAPRRLLAALELGDLDQLLITDPALHAFVEPMLSVTFAPTMVDASAAINVIPGAVSLHVDCRLPPGFAQDHAERKIRAVLASAEVDYELSWIQNVVGNGSAFDTPLRDAIADWLAVQEPDAKLVPFMLPAFTDSRTFRATFPTCTAYGFFPQRTLTLHESWPLIHGNDERIAVADVVWAADCYRHIIETLLV